MALLITIFAATVATYVWYTRKDLRDLKIGLLCYMFWGASMMWLGDAIFEYIELGADYFTPEATDMLNDIYLGFSVVALAMIIWTVRVLVSDPRGVVREVIKKER